MSNKILTAYFSASGVTRAVAEKLSKELASDLFEIKAKTPYTREDLNWQNKNSRSSVEMRDKSFRPEIAEGCKDLDKYDTIVIGFPIWWYVAPTIINTFLESGDFSGKKIILFATSGGSGFGKTAQELKPSVPKAEIKESMVLSGSVNDSKIKKLAEAIKAE